ncbi:hypothetical protein Leryth_021040 [Lithospermum erythrorhizon]|nr:hypothetical protein Leryth_021040 [Lithospermum erythrorhizon]
MNMESPDTKSNKSAGQYIPRGVVRSNSPKLPSRNHAVISQKAPQTKESTKPQEMKLHTQQRAVQRALFNYSVATKLFIMDQQKKQVEKLQKMIEKEEVRMLRKQMIPRAQLMPIFDKPFCPQRSRGHSLYPGTQIFAY